MALGKREWTYAFGLNVSENGKTLASFFFPAVSNSAILERPTSWMNFVSVENFLAKSLVAVCVDAPIWVKKFYEKKFQSPAGLPLTLHMATRLAESTLSLKNLRPRPGARGCFPSAVGSAADDNLTIPWSAPSKIPVYGWLPELTNLTFPVAPTEWMYLVLVPSMDVGIVSPLPVNVGSIDSTKIPGSLAPGKEPDLSFEATTWAQIASYFDWADFAI